MNRNLLKLHSKNVIFRCAQFTAFLHCTENSEESFYLFLSVQNYQTFITFHPYPSKHRHQFVYIKLTNRTKAHLGCLTVIILNLDSLLNFTTWERKPSPSSDNFSAGPSTLQQFQNLANTISKADNELHFTTRVYVWILGSPWDFFTLRGTNSLANLKFSVTDIFSISGGRGWQVRQFGKNFFLSVQMSSISVWRLIKQIL